MQSTGQIAEHWRHEMQSSASIKRSPREPRGILSCVSGYWMVTDFPRFTFENTRSVIAIPLAVDTAESFKTPMYSEKVICPPRPKQYQGFQWWRPDRPPSTLVQSRKGC